MIEEIYNSIEGLDKLRSIYDQIDKEIESFVEKSGLQCPGLCGKCCNTHSYNIESTVFEMILPAMELLENGKAQLFIEKLGNSPEELRCVFFNPGKTHDKGRCAYYHNRGLVCRLFGFSGFFDKYSNITFSLCSKIKSEKPEKETFIQNLIENGLNIPLLSFYRHELLDLNPLLAEKLYPINTALKIALEKTGYYLTLL
jgi:uncharacterized protein